MVQLTLRDGIKVLEGRALFARTTLWIYMALTLALIASWMAVLAAGIDQDAAPDHPALIAAGVVSLVWVLAFAACMVSVCMWVYRAHANLFAADLDGLQFTPAWSVGWFFVPFAFWFKPFQAMRELWNASHLLADDEAAPAERRLTVWWGLWVTGNIGLNISTRLSGMMGAINALDIVSYLLLGGAAWCLLQIVDAITNAQGSQLNAVHALA